MFTINSTYVSLFRCDSTYYSPVVSGILRQNAQVGHHHRENLRPYEKLLVTLTEEFSNLVSEADALSTAVKELLLSGGSGGIENSKASAEATLRVLAKISSVLRAENLAPNEDERHHAISPELEDAWNGVASVARAVRAVDGDSEDVNFLLRAHAIEHQLGDAVEKEPLLIVAQSKVANLEKVRRFWHFVLLRMHSATS